jgi:hypothetical protein
VQATGKNRGPPKSPLKSEILGKILEALVFPKLLILFPAPSLPTRDGAGSKITSCPSFESELVIKATSSILNGKLAKYHSPLNKDSFLIQFVIVEELVFTRSAKALTEEHIITNCRKEL